MSSPVVAFTIRMSRSWTSMITWVPVWVRPIPMWWSLPLTRRVTQPVLSTIVADAVVGVGVSARRWQCFGQRLVDRGGGGPVRQRAVWPVLVVLGGEGVQEGLELVDGRWLGRLGGEPLLEGLLEPFGLAAGGRVTWPGVLLHDVEPAQLVLERVASAAAAGEPGGVNHPVVGQCGRGDPVSGQRVAEGGDHDRAGDPGVRGNRQGVAGAVIEPGQDLSLGARMVTAASEAVVGEVRLPGLVRQPPRI
jgi:hypothetical protein